jgi:hypothetical protein
MENDLIDLYTARMQQERDAALNATSTDARKIHERMAREYGAMLDRLRVERSLSVDG